jgi:hypothetical protein
MRNTSKRQREAVAKWAEENYGSRDEATAYWDLMTAMQYITNVIACTDVELGALADLEDAWYDAREALARRCLAAMKKA